MSALFLAADFTMLLAAGIYRVPDHAPQLFSPSSLLPSSKNVWRYYNVTAS